MMHHSGESADWNSFTYMVYDVPNHGGTYKERYSQLGNCLVSLLLEVNI